MLPCLDSGPQLNDLRGTLLTLITIETFKARVSVAYVYRNPDTEKLKVFKSKPSEVREQPSERFSQEVWPHHFLDLVTAYTRVYPTENHSAPFPSSRTTCHTSKTSFYVP